MTEARFEQAHRSPATRNYLRPATFDDIARGDCSVSHLHMHWVPLVRQHILHEVFLLIKGSYAIAVPHPISCDQSFRCVFSRNHS